jgi:hypothetical protein
VVHEITAHKKRYKENSREGKQNKLQEGLFVFFYLDEGDSRPAYILSINGEIGKRYVSFRHHGVRIPMA